jgi:alpha-L-fucosidase
MIRRMTAVVAVGLVGAQAHGAEKAPADLQVVKGEHTQINIADDRLRKQPPNPHPEAQWFPEAGLGLFVHWGISSVKAMNISWPMIPGRPTAHRTSVLGGTRVENALERERILRERDFDLDGKRAVAPVEYWQMAKDFDPESYDPDSWLKAAREAGFTYAVLTAKHHEGFALWPSAFGDLNTKNYIRGRDLVRPFVEACRHHGLKVGLYFSPPDWYFDREHMDFLFHRVRDMNPEFPPLGPDLLPRRERKSAEDAARHQAEYRSMIRGQIEELLTRYGKIDLLWFDGRPAVPEPESIISLERIRELQPGIVVNPRLHGRGDYATFERRLPASRPEVNWAEFCNTWTSSWVHEEIPFRSNGFVLGQLAQSRAWGINYLLGVGPMESGEMSPRVYENMQAVGQWMKAHRESVVAARPLPAGESASVPATASGTARYLFAIPRFKDGGNLPEAQLPPEDETLELAGIGKPSAVRLLGTGEPVEFTYRDGELLVRIPATKRTPLVDVVRVDLEPAAEDRAAR